MDIPALAIHETKTDAGREFLAICKAIAAENKLDVKSFKELQQWLNHNSDVTISAVACMRILVKRVSADKLISKSESQELMDAARIIASGPKSTSSEITTKETKTPGNSANSGAVQDRIVHADEGLGNARAKIVLRHIAIWTLPPLFLGIFLFSVSRLVGTLISVVGGLIGLVIGGYFASKEIKTFRRRIVTVFDVVTKIDRDEGSSAGTKCYYLISALGDVQVSEYQYNDVRSRLNKKDFRPTGVSVEIECGVTESRKKARLWPPIRIKPDGQ